MSAPCIARARVHTHTHIPLLCDASILGSRLLEASILLATPTTRNTCESLARKRSSAMDLHSHRNQTKQCTTSVSIQQGEKKKKTKFVCLGSKHMFVNVPPSLRAKNQTDQANKDEPSSNQRDCSTNGQAHAHSEGMTKKGRQASPARRARPRDILCHQHPKGIGRAGAVREMGGGVEALTAYR